MILRLIRAATFLLSYSVTAEFALAETAVVHHEVIISGFEFVPDKLELSLGDTVTWVNKDIVPHNIAIEHAQYALSPDLARGEKFTLVVQTSLAYLCALHPSMKGKITIVNSE